MEDMKGDRRGRKINVLWLCVWGELVFWEWMIKVKICF